MILTGDALEKLKELPGDSVQCCVTSPPYYALRDYQLDGQVGLEDTVDEYIDKLIAVFNEVKRVLKKDGTCFVNMGDTYGGTKIGNSDEKNKSVNTKNFRKCAGTSKCLLQVPSRFSIAMTDNGWILRNRCIWWKPNAMPSSVRDRYMVDYEDVFFFTKNKHYYYNIDAIRESHGEDKRAFGLARAREYGYGGKGTYQDWYNKKKLGLIHPLGRIPRCVWKINTRAYKGAHFATFPEALVEPIIKAGAKERDTVLDPFAGSCTTGVVCKKLKRDFIVIELNPEYVKLGQERIESTPESI